jgi:serine protease Do
MNQTKNRWLAVATACALAGLFVAGMRFSMADELKAADLADLRDAVAAASKRGDNVDEVAKALDAFDKAIGKGIKADAKSPPVELVALRNAVEAAARKGENVDDIRKQLDAVEKKVVGRVLVAPKPAPPPLGDTPRSDPAPPMVRRLPNDFPVPRFEFPAPNREDFDKARELQLKALELMLKNPDDPEAVKLDREAMEQVMKALQGGRGGLMVPDLVFPGGGVFARAADRFRLGIRMEKLSPLTVEQLGLEAGRGIAVADVIAGSAAAKAGFKANDIIMEFAGKPVSDDTDEFNKQVAAVKAGEKVDAVVLRKGKKVEIKGIAMPEPAPEPVLPNGRVRPRPRFEPVPLPPLAPNVPGRAFDLDDIAPLGRNASGTVVTFGSGNFTIKSETDGTSYTIQGKSENGETKLTEVTIKIDGKSTKYESLDMVPAEHKPMVEKLLKTIRPGR